MAYCWDVCDSAGRRTDDAGVRLSCILYDIITAASTVYAHWRRVATTPPPHRRALPLCGLRTLSFALRVWAWTKHTYYRQVLTPRLHHFLPAPLPATAPCRSVLFVPVFMPFWRRTVALPARCRSRSLLRHHSATILTFYRFIVFVCDATLGLPAMFLPGSAFRV